MDFRRLLRLSETLWRQTHFQDTAHENYDLGCLFAISKIHLRELRSIPSDNFELSLLTAALYALIYYHKAIYARALVLVGVPVQGYTEFRFQYTKNHLPGYQISSPLHLAVAHDSVEEVLCLLEGAHPDSVVDWLGRTPVALAIESVLEQRVSNELVLLLVLKGADPAQSEISPFSKLPFDSVQTLELALFIAQAAKPSFRIVEKILNTAAGINILALGIERIPDLTSEYPHLTHHLDADALSHKSHIMQYLKRADLRRRFVEGLKNNRRLLLEIALTQGEASATAIAYELKDVPSKEALNRRLTEHTEYDKKYNAFYATLSEGKEDLLRSGDLAQVSREASEALWYETWERDLADDLVDYWASMGIQTLAVEEPVPLSPEALKNLEDFGLDLKAAFEKAELDLKAVLSMCDIKEPQTTTTLPEASGSIHSAVSSGFKRISRLRNFIPNRSKGKSVEK